MANTIAELEQQLATLNAESEVLRKKIEGLKEEIIADLTSTLPISIDDGLDRIIERHPDIINKMSDAQVAELRRACSEAKSAASARVISELKSSHGWLVCDEQSGHSQKVAFDLSGTLFHILQSFEQEFVPILEKAGFRKESNFFPGRTDLAPINLSYIRSDKIQELAGKLLSITMEYCNKKHDVVELQKQLESKKALSKWKS